MSRILNNYNKQKVSKGKTSIFRSVVEVIAIFLFIIILVTVGFRYKIMENLKTCSEKINDMIQTLNEGVIKNQELKLPNVSKFDKLNPIEIENKQFFEQFQNLIDSINKIHERIKEYFDFINKLLSELLKIRHYLDDLAAWFKHKVDVSQLKEQEILVQTYKKTFDTENDLVKGWENQINKIKEKIKTTPTDTSIQTIDSCKETIDSIDTLNKQIFSKVREKIETYTTNINGDIIRFKVCESSVEHIDKMKINAIMSEVDQMLKYGFNVITVAGHADNQSAKKCPFYKTNRLLSFARAEYVSKMIETYLLEKQKRKRVDFVICTSAYGSYLPADNRKAVNKKMAQEIRANNRRIVITFSKRKIKKGSN